MGEKQFRPNPLVEDSPIEDSQGLPLWIRRQYWPESRWVHFRISIRHLLFHFGTIRSLYSDSSFGCIRAYFVIGGFSRRELQNWRNWKWTPFNFIPPDLWKTLAKKTRENIVIVLSDPSIYWPSSGWAIGLQIRRCWVRFRASEEIFSRQFFKIDFFLIFLST